MPPPLMKIKKFTAFVLRGRGNASKDRSAEIRELSQQFGISLINGSLNLVGESPVWLDSRKAIYTNGRTHFYWKCHLNNIPVILNRWSEGCPVHVYEIFSEEHLRSKLGLSDGDSVVLEISPDIIDREKDSSRLSQIVWYLTWWRREQRVYRTACTRGSSVFGVSAG